MSIENLILLVISVTVSYLICLLQNATDDITKCDIYFITKCDRSLLQNASAFLLQNGTVITKCDVYYKLRQYIQQHVFLIPSLSLYVSILLVILVRDTFYPFYKQNQLK